MSLLCSTTGFDDEEAVLQVDSAPGQHTLTEVLVENLHCAHMWFFYAEA